MRNSTICLLVGLGIIFSGFVALEIPIIILYLCLRAKENAAKQQLNLCEFYVKKEQSAPKTKPTEPKADEFFEKMGIFGIVTKE